MDGVSSGAGRLHGGPKRGKVCSELGWLVLGGFGSCTALAMLRALHAVLSAQLMWLQTVCCRVPHGQGEVKCFTPIECFRKGLLQQPWQEGGLGDLHGQPEWKGKDREETELRNEKLSACSPEQRQALVVPPVTLG